MRPWPLRGLTGCRRGKHTDDANTAWLVLSLRGQRQLRGTKEGPSFWEGV